MLRTLRRTVGIDRTTWGRYLNVNPSALPREPPLPSFGSTVTPLTFYSPYSLLVYRFLTYPLQDLTGAVPPHSDCLL